MKAFILTSTADGGNDTRLLGVFPSMAEAIANMHPAAATALRGKAAPPLVSPGLWGIKLTGLPEYQVAELDLERDGSPGFDAQVLETAAEVLRDRYGLLTAGGAITLLRNRAEAIRKAAG